MQKRLTTLTQNRPRPAVASLCETVMINYHVVIPELKRSAKNCTLLRLKFFGRYTNQNELISRPRPTCLKLDLNG